MLFAAFVRSLFDSRSYASRIHDTCSSLNIVHIIATFVPLASDAHGCANAALAGSDGAACTSSLITYHWFLAPNLQSPVKNKTKKLLQINNASHEINGLDVVYFAK